METSDKKWTVICDDEKWFFKTRKKAREFSRGLNRHPANANIRLFGPYLNANGIARVQRAS